MKYDRMIERECGFHIVPFVKWFAVGLIGNGDGPLNKISGIGLEWRLSGLVGNCEQKRRDEMGDGIGRIGEKKKFCLMNGRWSIWPANEKNWLPQPSFHVGIFTQYRESDKNILLKSQRRYLLSVTRYMCLQQMR